METTTLQLVPDPPQPVRSPLEAPGARRRGRGADPRTRRRVTPPGALMSALHAARRRASRFAREERGAVTAEYAIVILAAVAFAGLLVAIMQSAEIRAMLVQLVENALGAGS